MKKIISMLIVFILLFSMTSVALAAKTYKVYFDLTSDDNILFSTYDMNVYVDDEYIGTLEDGKHMTALVELEKGKHVLEVTQDGKSKNRDTEKFKIDGETTVRALIKHGKNDIDIKKFKTDKGLIGAALKVPDVTGKALKDGLKKLEKEGFVNIDTSPSLASLDSDNWIIKSQSVNPGEVVDKNEYIELICYEIEEDDGFYEDIKEAREYIEKDKEPELVDLVDIKTLYTMYLTDKKMAEALYDGKTIQVKGTVTSVLDLYVKYTVTLESHYDDIDIPFVCTFEMDQKASLETIKEGDEVIIQGDCGGLTLLVLNLSECEIVPEIEESEEMNMGE